MCASPSFSRQAGPIRKDAGVGVAAAAGGGGACCAPDTAPKKLEHDYQYGVHRFPRRGGELDWGLALSGGGVRSAAFSIGAMKSLHDKGIMGHIDVISSVSGGGYALYWLLTNYEKNKGSAFGEAAFADDKFVQNVCELQKVGRSHLVTNKDYLRILFKQLTWRGQAAFTDYKEAIEWSFGNVPLDGDPEEKPLGLLTNEIEDGCAPYFIINSTLKLGSKDKKKTPKLKERSSEVFEISPGFRGNPVIGFRDWERDCRPTLGASVAMSGAPKFLGLVGIEGKVDNFSRETVGGDYLYLKDGGFSENLGALALIRRGIKNVVIIDAEADPHYKFDAYLKLQKMLQREGINFRVPDIELFLKKPEDRLEVRGVKPEKGYRKGVFSPPGVSVGLASRAPVDGEINSLIYYVKMSAPEAILPEYFSCIGKDKEDSEGDKQCAFITEGREIENERQCDLSCQKIEGSDGKQCREHRAKNPVCDCEGVPIDCRKIDLGMGAKERSYEKLYANVVWYYSRFLNKPKVDGVKGLGLLGLTASFNTAGHVCYFVTKPGFLSGTPREVCSVLSYNFPHITTLDQSYSSDQLEAFVGLGYLQTGKLKKWTEQ